MERTVGGKQDGFQLVVKADGNYITVYPEGEGVAVVDLATLRKHLEDEGITDYDVLQTVLKRGSKLRRGTPPRMLSYPLPSRLHVMR